jgi:hypothetical protein
LFIGFAAGLGVDRLVPRLGQAGLIAGVLLGTAGSAYLMIREGRKLLEDDGSTKEEE